MLSMGKWEYIAAPGYLLVLILLLSIDGKGEQGEIWVQKTRGELLSLCLVLIRKGASYNHPLHVLRELAGKKTHKRQNNTGQRAKDDSQLRLLQWAFLAKEKNSNNNKNFAIKFPKHSQQRRKTRE